MDSPQKARRLRLKEQGLCVVCGKNRDNQTIKCNKCKGKMNVGQKRIYQENKVEISKKFKLDYNNKKMNNLCVDCGKVNDTEYMRCNVCIAKQVQYSHNYRKTPKYKIVKKVYRENRHLQGKCQNCASQAILNQVYCKRCLDKISVASKLRKEERKQNGLCVKCAKPAVEGITFCSDCRTKNLERCNNRRKTWALAGCCDKCGSADKLLGVTTCETCWYKDVSRRHLGKVIFAEQLKMLLESQNNICPYTGEQLLIGKNASLDHIQPLSRGGTNDFSNLQWVTTKINMQKYDLTHDEFLDLCRQVAAHTTK